MTEKGTITDAYMTRGGNGAEMRKWMILSLSTANLVKVIK